jgi:hypothetical protein
MKYSNSLPLVLATVCSVALSSRADTIFSDTFGSGSTINGTPAAPTSTTAAYQNWSQGAVPANYSIASGALHFEARNTSSVFAEIQAQFAATPVSLLSIGDTVDLNLVFTDTSNVLLSGQNASSQIDIGLFSSGGTLPLTGNRLDLGTASTGGAAGYTGYIGRLYLNGNANIITRPAQSGGTLSSDQDLLFNNAGGGAFFSPTGVQIGSTATTGFTTGLTQGSQYTIDYSITLATATTATITESLYSGNGTGGTLLATQSVTGTAPTTSFDSLALGWRRSAAGAASSLDVNSILVTTPAPEPTTLALATLGGLGLLTVRRWKRRE